MPGNGYSSVDGNAPPPAAGATIADPSSSGHQDVAASSSYVYQGGLDCTGCQILREIVHSNGSETTKLCIHGAAAMFYHATLEVYAPNPEGSALSMAHQSFIDFRNRDYGWVKNYLMEYAQQCAGGGYTVVHDSISDFHDVLCTSMAGGVPLADDGRREVAELAEEADNNVADQQVSADAGDAIQPMIERDDMPTASVVGPSQPNNAVEEQQQQDVRPPGKSILAIQRDRTSKLELRDISRFFHLTIEKASKELRVGTTALKNISRKFGIPYWPYRTIRKIDTRIVKLRKNGNGSAAATEEIQKLNHIRRMIIMGHPKALSRCTSEK
ncbi:hypothetical protein QOZ80_5BG0433300 [Eleusine coracana subsp. coracana]|nr:hypothetical protein QOZ80_5BG0433300 [Eleusine coracana subsp. coracana]